MKNFSNLHHEFAYREKELDAQTGKHLEWTESDQKKRIKRAQEDPLYFAKEYFPEHWFPIAFAWFHQLLSDLWYNHLKSFHVFVGFRGAGKTRLSRVLLIHSNIFGIYHFFGITSRTKDLARAASRLMKLELEKNPKILADFGHLVDPTRNADSDWKTLPTAHNELGTVNRCYSLSSTPRGELEDIRVDFLYFEDVEDFESSINPEQTDKRLSILKKDFLEAVHENRWNALMNTNNPVETCIANRLINMTPEERNEEFPKSRVTVVPRWNEGGYVNEAGEYVPGNTLVMNKPVDEETEWPLSVVRHINGPNWPEKDGYSFDSQEAMRSALEIDVETWSSEHQCEPFTPQGDVFKRENWNNYQFLPDDATGIIWVDPAHGTKTSYKAAATILFSPTTRKIYKLMPFCRNSGWDSLFGHLHMVLNRIGPRISSIYWENYFGQDSYICFQEIGAYRLNFPLPIIPDQIPGEKHTRCLRYEPYFNGGMVEHDPDFTRTEDGVTAKRMIVSYKRGKGKIDYLDATACGLAKLSQLIGGFNQDEDLQEQSKPALYKRKKNKYDW